MTETSARVLVGDVGGTHARFAIVERDSQGNWSIGQRKDLEAGAFAKFEDAVGAYLGQLGPGAAPQVAGIAVAGPVTDGAVTFTNRNWHASEASLRNLGIARPLLINDFGALSFGVATLKPGDLRTIGPELPGMKDEPITILGAGTGFGVSCLARYRGRAIPMSTEGGHIGFAPTDAREIDVLQRLARSGRVSVERILSGPGLEHLHVALLEIDGQPPQNLPAAEIVAAADRGDAAAGETLSMFCAVFGAVAGDFALAHGARGGVLIAGGIALKIADHLEHSRFRAQFENKGRLSYFVKPIPTRLITTEDVAFLGAARASLEFAQAS